MTRGDRIRRERLRQKLSRRELGARIGVSEKTIQRIEAGERTQHLFLIEEALGLPSTDQAHDEHDEDQMLRSVPDHKFWIEAARRAMLNADTPTGSAQPGGTQPRRGRRATPPRHLLDQQEVNRATTEG